MKVKEGLRGESVHCALCVLEGHNELPQNLLLQLLEIAASKPGAEQFAQVLTLCAAAGFRVDIQGYAKVLGAMIQREAPVAQLRMFMNLLLPDGGNIVPLVPSDIPSEDVEAAFEDEPDQQSGDEHDQVGDPPSEVELVRCAAHPEINGCYELDPELTSYGRPAYQRVDEPRTVLHFRKSGADAKAGWRIGRTYDGETLAFNVRESKLPPRTGWQMLVGNSRLADPATFVTKNQKLGQSSCENCSKALKRVDLESLCAMVTHRDQDTLQYFAHFCVLLHLEYLAEVSSIRRRRSQGSEQLVRTGWALTGLSVKAVFGRRDGGRKMLPGWQDNGSEMIALVLPREFDMERCRFLRGDCVTLSEQDPLRDRVGEGLITSVKPGVMVVQLSGRLPKGRGKTWRIDKAANRTTYDRQFAALLQIATAGKLAPCCELLVAARVGALDSDARMHRSATSPDEKDGKVQRAAQIAAEKPRSDDGKFQQAMGDLGDTGMNESQRNALLGSLNRTCTIVQGPPGTGKTHVSVQVLRLWKVLGMTPLLATSDSNVAVDNIAAGLHGVGVRVVRVGRPEKVRGQLEEITLEAQVQKAKEKKAQELAEASNSDGSERVASRQKGRDAAVSLEDEHELRRQANRQDFELQMKILREAEVVCTTTISAGGDFLSKLHFSGILIDEVAQATELSAVVPIVLRGGNALKRLVLVGDHCQLPPGIASQEAESRGLSLSIYSRLQGGGVEPTFLDTQYRSHPKLVEFSSQVFYNGALGSGIDASVRLPLRGIPWPNREVPVAFVDVHASEEAEGDSKYNPTEAEQVLRLVRQVLSAGELTLNDIGIVTPYASQVRRLRQLLRPLVPRGTNPRFLEIASVDAFQGREKELIVFSAVRCNTRGTVGFLGDWRRLNVMLTRARRGLVVFGSAATLSHDPHWKQWLVWCQKNGTVHGPALPCSSVKAQGSSGSSSSRSHSTSSKSCSRSRSRRKSPRRPSGWDQVSNVRVNGQCDAVRHPSSWPVVAQPAIAAGMQGVTVRHVTPSPRAWSGAIGEARAPGSFVRGVGIGQGRAPSPCGPCGYPPGAVLSMPSGRPAGRGAVPGGALWPATNTVFLTPPLLASFSGRGKC